MGHAQKMFSSNNKFSQPSSNTDFAINLIGFCSDFNIEAPKKNFPVSVFSIQRQEKDFHFKIMENWK